MKEFIVKNRKALISAIAILLIGGITMSFQDSPFSYNRFAVQDNGPDQQKICIDTVPDKSYNKGMTMKEFDKLQEDLEKTLRETMDEIKKTDFSKMQKDIEASLKSVDMDKIMKDVERSIK